MTSDEKPQANDAGLEARRRDLSGRLSEVKTHESRDGVGGEFVRDASGLGQAMRLSAEFVGGVIAGGVLGWLIDHFAGSSPFGLIVCTLLGFCAGIMNMMRAAGVLPQWGQKR
jgi:ATP synthase protein I